MDEIQAELLKYDGPNVVMKFVDLLNACWRTQAVSKDWQKGTVIKLPKKGNTMECTNLHGINLLSVPGKMFSTVLLRQLQAAIDKRLRKETGWLPEKTIM